MTIPKEPLVQETWGTRQRLEAQISSLDQSGLDELLDRVLRMGNAPRFIAKFHPQAAWLWRQWRGTVLHKCALPAGFMMLVSVVLVYAMEHVRLEGDHKWTLLEVPSADDSMVARLRGFTTMWGYLLTMATFVNSFFLSQAYGFWLASKGNTRKVQGRLNDLGMLLATHAQRDGATGRFTPESHELLVDVARYVRLYHLLFWAGQALLARGALTEREHGLLVHNTRLPETQRHSWLEGRFLEEACKLRAVCASIADDAAARMPLAYVHLVQLLVDCLVALAPFALYPKLGVLTALLSPILVIFYRGFLQLSKSLLDPFGNEDSADENFNVFTLICSVRWLSAVEELPFAPAPPVKGKFFG